MTYSIVARDPVTGELGAAVQSGTFGVGTVVPWARPGVGVVATQAIAEPAYGPRCLDALAAGSSATEALEAAAAADAAAFLRQVGVVAADGTVAAVTGGGCIDHAGHLLGDGFAVQANMMASPRVWPAMADAFTAAAGPLPRRLLAALEAAQRAGGDARGMMSAALLVVDGQPADPWAGRLVDLRVDRAADPVADLRRLLDASDAYAILGQAVGELLGGDADARPQPCHGGPGHAAGGGEPAFPARRGAGGPWRPLRRPGRATVPARRTPELGGHNPQFRGQGPARRAARHIGRHPAG